MTKPKSKSQAKQNATKSHAQPSPADAAPKTTSAGAATTRAKKVLVALSPGWPLLSKSQVSTFTTRYTDAKCEGAGGKTKSEGVLGDAIAWAPVMAKWLKAEPTALRRYSPERFSWFLRCIGALADARALQLTQGAPAVAAKRLLEQVRDAATDARRELIETLEEICDGSDDAEAKLSEALGSPADVDGLAASITSLATYARQWLGAGDEDAKTLVGSAGLTTAEVETAEAAASALVDAAADKTLEGRVVPTDAPPVNRAEGRVLMEMKAAYRVFANANARNKNIPKLVPGTATDVVVHPRAAKRVAPPAPPPPPPAPPTGDAAATAQK